jgi:ferritin-like metal-binding protein YciE
MPATSLDDLYSQKLQLLLDAEQQGLDAVPPLMQAVHDEKLRDALEMHRRQSEEHVRRLERLIGARRRPAETQECVSMRALIEETQNTVSSIEDPDAIDAYIIGAQQAIEHHEIAAYGTARSWARQLELEDDATSLQRTLDEEGEANELLSIIAEQRVNERASKGVEREVGIALGSEADGAGPGGTGRAPGQLTDVEAHRGADQR